MTRREQGSRHALAGGSLLASLHVARTSAKFDPSTTIFAQGDRCAGVMYLEKGSVRLSVTSPEVSSMK